MPPVDVFPPRRQPFTAILLGHQPLFDYGMLADVLPASPVVGGRVARYSIRMEFGPAKLVDHR